MVITELLTPIDLEPDLADRMRIVMRRRNATNSDIAEAMDVSPNSVSNWINGNTRPRRRDLAEFARVTGAPVEWLLEGETKKAPIANDGGREARPKGFEPLTFWSVVLPDSAAELIDLWETAEVVR